jgi:Ca2+-transporting ATPase
MNWHLQDISQTLIELDVAPDRGLSSVEAGRRLAFYGRNELIERGSKSPWRILREQFTSTMALILNAAAILSALVGAFRDSITIVAIVCLFAVLGFIQEYRAERAMLALKRLAIPFVRVRRDGAISEIPAVELVPGDIILLEAGNLVPADCRLTEVHNLRVQEAVLTGESEAVEKSAAVMAQESRSLGDRRNMIYMGTTVSHGRGVALVVAAGMATELGRIATLLQNVPERGTPLQKRLDRLGKVLAALAVAVSALIFVIGVLRGEDLRLMLMTAVSLAVAAIPEGLPAVVVITLAIGSQAMLRRQALIRKLPAVETLGSVTVICSDKTGTLTANQMTVTEIVPVSGVQGKMQLLACAALCNDAMLKEAGEGDVGDPTETALLSAAAEHGLVRPELDRIFPRVAEVPFDSAIKRMETIHHIADVAAATALGFSIPVNGLRLVIVKGALDAVLKQCEGIGESDGSFSLGAAERQAVEKEANRLAATGHRVLALACGMVKRDLHHGDGCGDAKGLTLLGLIAMTDPPRPEARAAVDLCRQAGIRVVMITGDHPLTAGAIAASLGIGGNGRVLTGADLERIGPDGLSEAVGDVSVYARVSPEHKLMIVEALQKNGEVVAMTGDGVNDAPALKKADIGVSMGITGTDVAREAADMVLLDDNFATIVSAVDAGRTIYDNIRKFIVFSVSGNLGKIMVVLLLPFMGLPMPLTPLQLLWLNLLTDGLLGLGMGMERPEPDVMNRPPLSPLSQIFDRHTVRRVALTGCVIGSAAIAVAWYFWRYQYLHPYESWQSVLFTSLVSAQIGQALALRSFRHCLPRMGFFTNPVLLAMIAAVALLQGAVLYLPVLQPWFRTVPLYGHGLAAAIVPGVLVFAVLELEKALHGRSVD